MPVLNYNYADSSTVERIDNPQFEEITEVKTDYRPLICDRPADVHRATYVGRSGIGPNDAASFVGLNPDKPASLVIMRKMGMADTPNDPSMDVWRATTNAAVEPLLQKFKRETHLEVWKDNTIYQHPLYPWMMTNVAGFLKSRTGEIVPIITKFYSPTSPFASDAYVEETRWASGTYGDDGRIGSEANVMYATHVLSVLNMNRCLFLAISDFRAGNMIEVIFNRDLELERQLINAEGKAWTDMKDAGEIPDDGGSLTERAYDTIVRSFALPERERQDPVDIVDPSVHEAVEKVNSLNEEIKAEKKKMNDLNDQLNAEKAKLAEALQGHESATCGSWRISFKGTVRPSLNTKALKANYPEIYDQFVEQKLTKPILKIKKQE